MTDHELELQLRRWFREAIDERETAPPALRAALPAVLTIPSPVRLVGGWRSPGLLAAALFTVALVGSAIAVGSGVVRVPAVLPSLDARPTIGPARASASADTNALIAYTRVTEIWPATCPSPGFGVRCPGAHYASELWTIRADGSDPHSVFPGRPDARIAGASWSTDGARLVFSEDGAVYVSDPGGTNATLIETGCRQPCTGDTLPSFSADGTKLAFVRLLASGSSVIATVDLASGNAVELGSTLSSASVGAPRWSPDGTQIVYSVGGKFNDDNVVFVVEGDGSNLRRLNPASLPGRSPDWSPDGTLIVFSSFDDRTVSVPGDNARAMLVRDIYTIRPDGSGLSQLTMDGWSRGATWTPEGRILFVRVPLDGGNSPTSDSSSGFWTMAADGGGLRPIPGSATAVTPDAYFDDAIAFWQPTP
jgi:dipeptidyl aminopeptidase/acylaminoacyl peptidase